MTSEQSIFISYRRIDSNWAAVALRHHINRTFPRVKVFMDLSGIEPGEDFPTAINRSVDQCQVMLAVIGPNWLGASDNHGRRRLDNPNDFVRLEIVRGLERDIRLIPILVDDAPMPKADALPDPLKALAIRNGVSVRHISNERDFDEICGFLEQYLGVCQRPAGDMSSISVPFAGGPAGVADRAGDAAAGLAAAAALKDAGVDPKTMLAVAQMRHEVGDFAVEEQVRRVAQPMLDDAEGTESNWSLNNRQNTAFAVLQQGRASEAEAAFRTLLPLMEKVQGAEHPGTLTTRHYLARAILDQGRAAEAEAAFRALHTLYEKVQGAEHPGTLITRHSLARAILDQGRASEAETALRTLLPLEEKVKGAEHQHALVTRVLLALACLEQGAIDGAREALVGVTAGGLVQTPNHLARFALVRAFLKDQERDAIAAEAALAQAMEIAAPLTPEHPTRRSIDHYTKTRVPGGVGGSTLWAAS
ncbi:MAG: toll/interleukin-1 receptor domain-containing protein [Pseudomonadota bacterium]